MPSLKDLTKEMEDTCLEELSKLGFAPKNKRLQGSPLCAIDENTLGWVGMNRGTYPYEQIIALHPVCGVINKKVAVLVKQWFDIDAMEHLTPTVCIPLYELCMPPREYRNWNFDRVGDSSEMAKDFADKVQRYGIPWMQRMTEKDEIVACLEAGGALTLEPKYWRIPATYVAFDDHDGARKYIKKALAEFKERQKTEKQGHWTRFEEQYRTALKEYIELSRAGSSSTPPSW